MPPAPETLPPPRRPASMPVSLHLFGRKQELFKSVDDLERVVAMLRALGPDPDRYDLDVERVVAKLRDRIDAEEAEVARIDAVFLKAEGRTA